MLTGDALDPPVWSILLNSLSLTHTHTLSLYLATEPPERVRSLWPARTRQTSSWYLQAGACSPRCARPCSCTHACQGSARKRMTTSWHREGCAESILTQGSFAASDPTSSGTLLGVYASLYAAIHIWVFERVRERQSGGGCDTNVQPAQHPRSALRYLQKCSDAISKHSVLIERISLRRRSPHPPLLS